MSRCRLFPASEDKARAAARQIIADLDQPAEEHPAMPKPKPKPRTMPNVEDELSDLGILPKKPNPTPDLDRSYEARTMVVLVIVGIILVAVRYAAP